MHIKAAINTAKFVLIAIAGGILGVTAVTLLTPYQLGICLAVGVLAGLINLVYNIEKEKLQ